MSRIAERNMPSSAGEKIKELRLSMGMTLAACARGIGISTSYLNRIEKGRRRCVTHCILQKIASTLKVPLSIILGEEDKKADENVAFEVLLMLNKVEFDGQVMNRKQKQLVFEILQKVMQSNWTEAEKLQEINAIIDLVEKLRQAKLSKAS